MFGSICKAFDNGHIPKIIEQPIVIKRPEHFKFSNKRGCQFWICSTGIDGLIKLEDKPVGSIYSLIQEIPHIVKVRLVIFPGVLRSEERRVGKESRARW